MKRLFISVSYVSSDFVINERVAVKFGPKDWRFGYIERIDQDSVTIKYLNGDREVRNSSSKNIRKFPEKGKRKVCTQWVELPA